MPMIDRQCDTCARVEVDKFYHTRARANAGEPCECGGVLMRTLLPGQHYTNVNPDGIPGGIYIQNGLCHADGTPRRFDSRSELRREAKARGMTWGFDGPHVGKRGSDKHPDTTKWT